MNHTSDRLKKSTLVVTVIIVGSLFITALGGIIKMPVLIYFWYLTLLGIVAMIALMVISAVNWLLYTLSHRYGHMLEKGSKRLHWMSS